MKIGLFIPCFIDLLYPEAGTATLELLKKSGHEVHYPHEQTCCGQPMANTGCEKDVRRLARKFLKLFRDYDCVVSPSASCVVMVKEQYPAYLAGEPGFDHLTSNIYEICEFIHDLGPSMQTDASFPYRVGIHHSCHVHRMLHLGSPSELRMKGVSKIHNLLAGVRDIEIVHLSREDECCGFGGTFSVNEPELSVFMGNDRIRDHLAAGAEYITGADYSCLMHMEAIIKREQYPVKVIHVAEILNAASK